MYGKIKYMMYMSIFLILIFFVLLIITSSKQKDKELKEIIENQRLEQQVEQNNKNITQEAIQVKNDQKQENQYQEDIVQPEIINTETNSIEPNKKKKKNDSYEITVENYPKINTNSEEFGKLYKNDEENINIAAQILDKSKILLYSFSTDDCILKWQTLISKTDNKKIIPKHLEKENNNIYLTIKEEETNKDIFLDFESDAEGSNYTLVAKDTDRIYDFSGKEIKSIKPVQKIKINNNIFYIICYTNMNSAPSYSKNIMREFYLYKQQNSSLKMCIFLFKGLSKKDVLLNELITVNQENNYIKVRYNGLNSISKIIYNSQLIGQSAKYQNGPTFYLHRSINVEKSNYKININKFEGKQ